MYKDPITGLYELPWVRLHATKDYFDTAVILENYPKIKSNFNLVPSLLTQLDEYSKGTAKDKFMDLTLKKASELSEDERIFILENFFMANKDTMIYPYPRYAKLLEKRGDPYKRENSKRINKYFSEVCLLKQIFIKDDKKSIEQIMKEVDQELKIIKFVRYSL